MPTHGQWRRPTGDTSLPELASFPQRGRRCAQWPHRNLFWNTSCVDGPVDRLDAGHSVCLSRAPHCPHGTRQSSLHCPEAKPLPDVTPKASLGPLILVGTDAPAEAVQASCNVGHTCGSWQCTSPCSPLEIALRWLVFHRDDYRECLAWRPPHVPSSRLGTEDGLIAWHNRLLLGGRVIARPLCSSLPG